MFPLSIRRDGLCLVDTEEGFEGDVHSEKTLHIQLGPSVRELVWMFGDQEKGLDEKWEHVSVR